MPRKKTNEDKLICTLHGEIENHVDKIKNFALCNMTIKQLLKAQDQIDKICFKIKDLVEIANKKAQAMEDRLFEYKSTIESLGFERKRNSK